jgi:hypothetical protein
MDPRIQQYILEKQALEMELAYDLRDIFDTEETLIGPLRQLTSFAVDELDAVRSASMEGHRVFTKAWSDEAKKVGNRTLLKYGSLSRITNSVPTLSAAECSDIIRLYGEVVEGGAAFQPAVKGFVPPANPLERFQGLDAQKARMRRGGTPVWKAGRQRDRSPSPAPPHVPAHMHEFVQGLKGGIASATLKDTSTVLKIDHVFGLLEAADISGTTTDSIFFIRRYANLFRRDFPVLAGAIEDPIYHLLALATLVAGGHHSLLESALSLSLNRHITGVDYRIGLYTTLLPVDTTHPAQSVILQKLRTAEEDPRNHLMLVYYDHPGDVGGAYVFERIGAERVEYERLAKADTFLLDRFRRFGDVWPGRRQVEWLRENLPH